MRGTSAVVGIGESKFYRPGGAPDTEFQQCIEAIEKAAADAGISVKDIDGFVSYSGDRNTPTRLATAMGIKEMRFNAMSWDGGGNGVCGAISIADAAITAGYANYIVCYRSLAQGQFGRFGQARVSGRQKMPGDMAFRYPYGMMVPAHQYAMISQRFMYEHNITENALAEVSLASYNHAQRNPRAVRYGKGITKEDYLNSRWIVEPFRLFDCCQENDGAAAAILTTGERARTMKNKPVYIRSAATGMEHRGSAGGMLGAGFNDPEFPTAHYRVIGERIWERAGVGPKDVQVAQFYENFTGMALMAICEMGFVEPDKAEEWVMAGNLQWPSGELPVNTAGGNLAEAYIHGFGIINESVRQVRGESTSQVKDVVNALAVAGPGALPASAALFSAEA